MAQDVEATVLDILQRIEADLTVARRDMGAFRDEVRAFREKADGRLDRLESLARKSHRDIAGLLVSANALAGHMELRMSHAENRVARLEAGSS